MDSEREAPKTPCTSGALSKPTPLGFHLVHGENIWVSKDRSLARRAQSSDNAITFSNRRVAIGEKVCLRIVEISEEWDGFLNIGFTSHNPDTLANALPKRACPDLSGMPGNWVRILEAMFFKPDDILHYYVNSFGEVHYAINEEDKGLLFSDVDTSTQLWAIVDVYGNCIGVQFTDLIQIRKSNALEDRPVANIRTLSVEESLPPLRYPNPVVPTCVHNTKGSNVKYVDVANGVAVRYDATVDQGYVFTALPIPPGQTIVVQILATDSIYTGSLAAGLTHCDPGTLKSCDLPNDAEMLIDRPEYWVVKANVANGLQQGDEIVLTLTQDGQFRISKNDSSPHTVLHVDPTITLWAFVDIFGSTTKVRMLSSVPALPATQPVPTSSVQQNDLSPNNLLPLHFHFVHGDNIVISQDGIMARRMRATDKGLTFSSRPVQVNEKIYLQFCEVSEHWSGVISFGFTKYDPVTLGYSLMERAYPNLINKPGYWVNTLGQRYCKQDNILYYYFNSSGVVNFGINGEDKGLFISSVDTSSPLWALVDIHGKNINVQFTNPSQPILLPTAQELLPPPRYPATLVPVRLHTTRGRNVMFMNERLGVAARTSSTVGQGYVFSESPMQPGQTIIVQILAETETTLPLNAGSLAIGVTSCSPRSIRSKDLTDMAEDLPTKTLGYWLVKRAEDFLTESDRLQIRDEIALTLTTDGQIQVSKNGSNPVTVSNVDITIRLWAFVDIYGTAKIIRMLKTQVISSKEPAPTPEQLWALTGSAASVNSRASSSFIL